MIKQQHYTLDIEPELIGKLYSDLLEYEKYKRIFQSKPRPVLITINEKEAIIKLRLK